MIKATPFHTRAADRNQANAWTNRAGYTVCEFYSGAEDEALTARSAVVLADISYRARLNIAGARAEEFLLQLATRNAAQLLPGVAVAARWLDENAVPQGEGIIARLGPEHFILETQGDVTWINHVASRFELYPDREEAGLVLIGPSVAPLLSVAGLSLPEAWRVAGMAWNGLDVVLSRFGAGVEIWCRPDDAELVWDRLIKAGSDFGIKPAGLAALDLLDMEAFAPVASAVDEEHIGFIGRNAWLAAQGQGARVSVGIDIDADTPAPHALLMRHGKVAGQIGASLYSPALGRAIGFASVTAADAEPGTELTLTLPPDAQNASSPIVAARVVSLPFLPL